MLYVELLQKSNKDLNTWFIIAIGDAIFQNNENFLVKC